MSTNIVTEPEPRGAVPPPGGSGPSVVRDDSPSLARGVGLAGAVVTILSAILLIAGLAGRQPPIDLGFFVVGLVAGLAALLFHAGFDGDIQFRRLYLGFAVLALLAGVLLMFIPYPDASGQQFGRGALLALVALLFLVAALRNETDEQVRTMALYGVGAAGAVFALVGLVGGSVRTDFLLGYGGVLALLGLTYLVVAIASRGVGDDVAYWAGVGVGLAGGVAFLVALGRSVLPALWRGLRGSTEAVPNYFAEAGLLVMILGLAFALAAALLVSDRPFFALTRRELGGFFYSPVAYLCMFGFAVAGAVWFIVWVFPMFAQRGVPEPIIGRFFVSIPNVLVNIFVVPALTMRLFSEEKRSGTYEVLVTAPVSDTSVVFSKFVAALVMYLAVVAPTALFLVAMRLAGAPAFDFHAVMSTAAAWLLTNAGFLAMGLFFSSLTRNQIVGAVLTFAGIMVPTVFYLVADTLERAGLQSEMMETGTRELVAVLNHCSYIHFWIEAIPGRLPVRLALVPLSMTAFFLFLTVKSMEARRWS